MDTNARIGLLVLAMSIGCSHKTPSLGKKKAHVDATPTYQNLAETGFDTCFYDGTCTNIEVLRFEPQYPLWSDGAEKLRWALIPPGTKVDTSNIDRWLFPIGTKFWKEFRIDGKRIETRFFEKKCERPGENEEQIDCWQYGSFRWNDDEPVNEPTKIRNAEPVPEKGLNAVADIVGATYSDTGHQVKHDIPARSDCNTCHARGGDPILGFDALQLSPDRDDAAPHGKNPLPEGYVTLRELIAKDILTDPPAEPWPRIQAEGIARAALGYFHGNCGSCHNSDPHAGLARNFAGENSLHFRHTSDSTRIDEEPAYKSAVNRFATGFNTTDNYTKYFSAAAKDPVSGKAGESIFDVSPYDQLKDLCPRDATYRIRGGNADASAIVFRMKFRHEMTYERQARWGNYDRDGDPPPDFVGSFTGDFAGHPLEENWQMPYVGTNVPDSDGIALISEWIGTLDAPLDSNTPPTTECPCTDANKPFCIGNRCSDKCNTNQNCIDLNQPQYCVNDGVCQESCGADDTCNDPETRSCVIKNGADRGKCDVTGPPPQLD